MIGEQQRRVDVEHRVRRELERIGMYRLPTNPIKIAHRLGLDVGYAELPDKTAVAMVSVKDGVGRISAVSMETPYRLRFAIAHELGHYLLHLMDGNTVQDGQIKDRAVDLFWEKEPPAGPISDDWMREIETNWFATELLMPMEFVREEWGRNPNIHHMARIFGVNEEAIGSRVAGLNLWIPAGKG